MFLLENRILWLICYLPFLDVTSSVRWWEPFENLHDFCSDCSPPIPESPDPLVSYTWGGNNHGLTAPQLYRVTTDECEFLPTSCAEVLKDAEHGANGMVVQHLPCSIRCDWGVERAGWMQVKVANSTRKNLTITGSLSEFNYPYPGKTRRMEYYPSTDLYRLETNDMLYEGIRYTWIYLEEDDLDKSLLPLTLVDLTLVTKNKPIDYIGSFRSSVPDLTRAWYTAVYSVRLNTETERFNSVLVERGDRVAIQGDGHPTIATSLVSFGLYDLIGNVLDETNSANHTVVDDTILSYPLLWCASVLEWWWARGKTLSPQLLRDVQMLLNRRIQDWLNWDLVLMGWDDRLGNGWCGHAAGDDCGLEAHQTFAGLVILLCMDLSKTLTQVGRHAEARKYIHITSRLRRSFRDEFMSETTPIHLKLKGVHAVASAISAGVIDPLEVDDVVRDVLDDAKTICSESPFNQYWILQALGIIDMERALASIQMCWTPMVRICSDCTQTRADRVCSLLLSLVSNYQRLFLGELRT